MVSGLVSSEKMCLSRARYIILRCCIFSAANTLTPGCGLKGGYTRYGDREINHQDQVFSGPFWEMNQPCRMSLVWQMGVTKREDTPLSPCFIRERELCLAALTRKLFSPWGLKGGGLGCAFAADGGASCQKHSAGMEQGSGVRACCEYRGTSEVTSHSCAEGLAVPR